jgi:hypothetical protein
LVDTEKLLLETLGIGFIVACVLLEVCVYYGNKIVWQRKGRIRSRGVDGLGEVLEGSAE